LKRLERSRVGHPLERVGVELPLQRREGDAAQPLEIDLG
jgi:hypothetical protein